ncbi:type II toxin-antitoxin system ParD family antitoxin [Flexivirga caeni]|uniref:type II toxin-antitoxin system ParD family antitoxin n=1 Tax=Flexivirga caeni TaxID=2294115 RepID=UPI001C660D14|nr:type II toxin-antitoxin system ParD family antitoxin [Flexivirga caeni]
MAVSIDIPADVAAAVDARVRSGRYASQGDVVRDGLRLLSEEDGIFRDAEVEHWLRTTVVPIAEATVADPSRSLTAEEARALVAAKRAARA